MHMKEFNVSPKRNLRKACLVTLTIAGSALLLICLGIGSYIWYHTHPIPVPDPFPPSEIVYDVQREGEERMLGFVNADGLNSSQFPFRIAPPSLVSTWGQPLITMDNKTLIVYELSVTIDSEGGRNIFAAHPGEIAVDCGWWGVTRLAPDGIYIHVETKQGLEEYSPEDCGTENNPQKIYSGVFGALSPDRQYSAELKYQTEDTDTIVYIYIRNLKTGEERNIGEGRYPVWSGDGQWLAYTGRDGIYIFQNQPSAEPRRLVTLEGPDPDKGKSVYWFNASAPMRYYPPVVSWSPDGQWLVYHTYSRLGETAQYSIYKVNVNTGETVKIIDDGMSPFWRWPEENP